MLSLLLAQTILQFYRKTNSQHQCQLLKLMNLSLITSAIYSNLRQFFFTNPATVEGTVKRLKHHANNYQKSLDLEVIVIDSTFELIMQGLKEEYNQEITKSLNQIMKDEKKVISVAQLSMVDASQQVEYKTSKTIINPLNTLVSYIVNQLELEKKNQL